MSKPSEPLQDARVATRSDLESELKPTPTSAVSGFEECLKTTPEGSERSDRRREVLNEALRREEAASAAGELAVPRESKDVPIQPDSDLRKRRAMNAATVDASSGRSQSESSRAVADESRTDFGRRERRIQKFDRTEHQDEES